MSLDGPSSIKEVLAEESLERFGKQAVRAFIVDVQMREERLVEQPAHLRVSSQVRGVAVAGKIKGASEVGFDLVKLRPGSAEPFLDGRKLASDALLLASNQVKRHRAAVDGLHQLLSLAGELGLLAGEVLVFALGVLAAGRQLRTESFFYGVTQRRVKPDRGPVVFDHLLDLGDQHGLAGTGGGLHVPPEADEVGVDDAVAVLGIGNDQPVAAGTAEHAGFEVVHVVALPLADEVGGEHVLHPLPRDRVDEWLVGALVDHAPVDHLTLVVGVGQDGVQHVRFH